ncbi:hypothetical protein CVT26_000563 [Gymnopilus dilepis]|uniref:Protein kinase domain-containing protein n=1 Tax=Gymnopilus dilepis TaxID=231916 RepID=A0A409VHB1_9AGAR|nr:hypothetical protein CVT26_000563 [Gymnopilus dilepis]
MSTRLKIATFHSPFKNSRRLYPSSHFLIRTNQPPSPDMVRAGDKIGNQNFRIYRKSRVSLVCIIGRGSSGYVWKAKDENSDKLVAVKVITSRTKSPVPSKCLLLSHMVSDLAPEALRHLCIAEDVGTMRGQGYIITRLYSTDLSTLINAERLFPLPKDHSTAIIWQILRGLYYLHSLGVIHGDIKPANILLKDAATFTCRQLGLDGEFQTRELLRSTEVVICDLDDARLPRQNAYLPAGTPPYRPPEVAECLDWDSKVDIFATGCVAYELFTRRQLFPEQNLTINALGHLNHVEILSQPMKWAFVRDPDALNFVQQSVQRLATQRPPVKLLLKHRLFGSLANIEIK